MQRILEQLGLRKDPDDSVDIGKLKRDYERLVYSKYPSVHDLILEFKTVIYTKSLRDFLLFEIVTEGLQPSVRRTFYEELQAELLRDLKKFRKEGRRNIIYFFFEFGEEIQIASVMLDYVREKLSKLSE
jgi:hypothetical protein